jgi:DNA-binding transcriptional LysR family regulator
MKNLEGIEAFAMAVEQGSLSAAALQLSVSKSHISRQIARLEQRLDTQLLIRTTRSLRTTEAGLAYYKRAADALRNLDEAERAISDMHDTPRGRLRITSAGAFAEDTLAPLLVQFMQRYPELEVDMEFSNRLIDIVAEGFDIAIRAGSLKDSSLIARRIASRQLLTCASPDYLARHGEPATPQSLQRFNCLQGTLGSWQFKQDSKELSIKISGNWRSNNGRALLHAATMGLGLVQLPAFYVNESIARGDLQCVLQEFAPHDESIWAVYPSNRYLSPRVRLLINFLVESLQP